ncbi:MAG: class I SAM-dependent methyltransferase [Collinsella sp.]|nr:class I SAM-dependent methyltransferase [Collinsella sp.]
MRPETARALIALNSHFYEQNATTFSATRQAPWRGWAEVLRIAREHGIGKDGEALHLLDLAAGNLRFERFLVDEAAPAAVAVTAIDGCPALLDGPAPATMRIRRVRLDVLRALIDNRELPSMDPADLAVCFGFMHHVPTAELRGRVVGALVRATRPGGLIALSFWRFMDDPRLARQARAVEAAAAAGPVDLADLKPGDHLLGWQGAAAPPRYCHHANEAELDALAYGTDGRAREVARFSADGPAGNLNRYLILERI